MADESSCLKTFRGLYKFLRNNRLDDITKFIANNWQGKEKQESVFRLFSYLNLIDEFKEYYIAVGNYDKKTIEPTTDMKLLLNQSLKDSGDKSDLSLINKSNDKDIIICSSKNMPNYHIGDLDIEKIFYIYKEKYEPYGYTITLCIIIPDKKYFWNVVNNSKSNNEYAKIICEKSIVLDHSDLNQYYARFLNNYTGRSANSLYYINKRPLNLYFHQKLCVEKFYKLLESHDDILLGCIQRSGKSYIMAGVIDHFSSLNRADEKQNYLIITTCPNETIKGYLELFENTLQFKDFGVYHVDNISKPDTLNKYTKNIIVCSSHFLKYKAGGSDRIRNIEWLKKISFNIRFIDEAHNGGTTELSEVVLQKYGNKSKSCYITATYTKPQSKFNIPREACILWDLEDIQLCKNLLDDQKENIARIQEKHGDVSALIEQYGIEQIAKTYSVYPELHLLTLSFQNDIEKEIIDETKNSKYGWSIESILLLKNDKKRVKNEFQNPDDVERLCYNIFGKMNKYSPDPLYENNVLSRIKTIIEAGPFKSRWFSRKNPLIIMCFLPCGTQCIDTLSKTFKKLLEDKNIIPDFEVGIINSKNNDDPLKEINDTKQKAKNSNKKGILILSGRQCSMGVSLYDCDIVLMLNNTKSMDQYFQMGFRSMTEAPGKKCGFIVDLNIHRVADVIVDCATKLFPSLTLGKAIHKMLKQRLITLNADDWMNAYFEMTHCSLSKISKTLFDIYNYNPSRNIAKLLDNLKFKFQLFSVDDQTLFNTLFKINAPTNSAKTKINEQILEILNTPSSIGTGIENIALEQEESKEESKTINEPQDVNFMQDILKHVIPLVSLLTIQESDKITLNEMIAHVNSIPDLKVILLGQIRTWWGKIIPESVLDLFINIYDKYLSNNDEFNVIVKRIKEILSLNVGDKHRLSQLIDAYLIPQEIEKKNNAEVSTPHHLRQDMLNLVDKYAAADFWKTPKKVFEPCSGKGGFLIDVVSRFMDNLPIEDAEERYRFIVEECLYFADINETNIYICKLLLDPYGKYRLNYSCGDTLALNISEKWGIKFDLVIGNPPYNTSSGLEARKGGYGGRSLWDKFVVKSLDQWIEMNGYLLFVHPPSWRKPEHYLWNTMKNKQLLYIKTVSEKDSIKIFKCSTMVDYYLLQNRENTLNSLLSGQDNKEYCINLLHWDFLPSGCINTISSILGNQEVIYSRTMYGTDKKNISKTESEIFKYPIVHTMTQKGLGYVYSNENKGHIGIKKVILNFGRHQYPYNDYEGKCGMSQISYGLKISSKEEGDNIVKAINSAQFREIIKYTKWSTFQTDWRMFKYFRPDFYLDFI